MLAAHNRRLAVSYVRNCCVSDTWTVPFMFGSLGLSCALGIWVKSVYFASQISFFFFLSIFLNGDILVSHCYVTLARIVLWRFKYEGLIHPRTKWHRPSKGNQHNNSLFEQLSIFDLLAQSTGRNVGLSYRVLHHCKEESTNLSLVQERK